MMVGLAVFLIFKRDLPYVVFIPLLLILAGGLGNLIDRVTNDGLVTDFIVMGVGPIRTGVFNVADIAVTFGGIAIAWLAFRPPISDPTNTHTPRR